MAHKFHIGQQVHIRPRRVAFGHQRTAYEITRLLPASGQDLFYRIKSTVDHQERVIREADILES
jgi:hypothetical protein